MLGYVAAAGPGTPNGVIDDVRPLDELSFTSGYDVTEDVVASIVMGLILGLTAAALVLWIRKAVISSRPVAPSGERAGPRTDRKRPGGRRRRRGGRRRGRRGA
jgi:hypothetical protein